MHKTYKKVVLVILDGFGVASPTHGNATTLARTPNINNFTAYYPAISLQASGPLVGLPWGEMGNSEVGHLNIGAGRIVGQDLPRITNAIQTGEFFKVSAFLAAIEHAKKNNSNLHLMGMVSPGGVHSLDEHLYALLGLAAEHGLQRVYVHMFTDGRDTDERVALESVKKLQNKISDLGAGVIATISGRFYAMDRGQHWDQTMLTYRALTEGRGETAPSAESAISQNYSRQIFDEIIKPTVIAPEGRPVAVVADHDAVVFTNFRQDRAIQLTEAFTQPESVPEAFRPQPLQNLFFVTMTEYRKDLPAHVAFPPMDLKNNLAEVLSASGRTQFHIAESEKYAHVTAFFNGGRVEKLPGEERLIVTSPDNAHNYVDQPQMSAPKLTETLVDKITKSETNFFVANFANPDMVGHTGVLKAAIAAVECIDEQLGKIAQACLLADAALVVTADHGNAEYMINVRTGEINKDHTTNPVPFFVIANEFRHKESSGLTYGGLSARVPSGVVCDIAPTILDLFGLPVPKEMTGINLLTVMLNQ